MNQPEHPKASDLPSDANAFDVSLVNNTAEPERVELVPIAPPPIDPLQMDVTLATDPLPQMDRLERSRWRWRFVALVSLIAFGIITPVSVMQFWGTFLTCQMLTEARLDAERAREETTRALDKSHKLYETVMLDRREAMSLRGQLSMLRDQWDQTQPRAVENRESLTAMNDKRQEILEVLAKEAEKMIEEIRREGQENAAFLEAVIQECYHGESVNPLVPKMTKPVVED
jgi:vacuolar-type H+-ATPase subunit H